MKTFCARYALRDGRCGHLTLIADSSCAAVIALIETFGEQLQRCSARPA